jgi:hypothetical protein
MAAGRVEPFADLVWEQVEASELIGEAFRYLVEDGVADSDPESIERWCSAWRNALERRADLRPFARDAFDAGILAFAFGHFGESGSGRALFEMCRAEAAPRPAALASLIAPDSGLGRDEIADVAREAAKAAAEHGSTLPPSRHPLCLLISAHGVLGLRDAAARLLVRVASDVHGAVIRQAARLLDDSPESVRADWDALHDALHPTVCLHELLSGNVDPRRVARAYQKGGLGELHAGGGDEGDAFEPDALGPDEEERIDESLTELLALAKLFRLDADKVRALSGAQLVEFLLKLAELEEGTPEGLAAARRLGAELGVARTSEAPKMGIPTSASDKNRRKRERRARKAGRGRRK